MATLLEAFFFLQNIKEFFHAQYHNLDIIGRIFFFVSFSLTLIVTL